MNTCPVDMQVQVQREAAAADGAQPAPGAGPPAAGAPANFFALPPPGAPMYASMDPTAMGTRGQNPNMALGKRPAGDGGPGEGVHIAGSMCINRQMLQPCNAPKVEACHTCLTAALV